MFLTYDNPIYDYIKSADQESATPAHHPLVIVGAGPVGLAAGIDAGQHGIATLVLDDDNTVSVGSRAVCYSKRALEIMDRLGCAKALIEKGVTWQVGKIFFRDQLVRQFDLLPEKGHKIPAFINLQQYYLEEFMVTRARELDQVEIRWKNRVVAVDDEADQVTVTVETPDGRYQLTCDWLIVADGANSGVRELMGLESTGQRFHDRFLIADIVMKADFPPERWFSFDPSYHPGQSTLLHRQPDNVWRLDFQLGWDADPDEEKKPENVAPRVKAMLGEDTEFELEWCSVYTFRCRRMERFRYGRILFVGDAAHQVSPFGARGANSGIQDIDNLIWKLKLVLDGLATDSLVDSYSEERVAAADENILNSTRATDFITPKSEVSRTFRNAVLELSRALPFAQGLINSGRLSDPAFLTDSPLNTPQQDTFVGAMIPGAVMDDAPIVDNSGANWLLEVVRGRFAVIYFADRADRIDQRTIMELQSLEAHPISADVLVAARSGSAGPLRTVLDEQGLMFERYDATPETTYVVRPDQHVVARWRSLDPDRIRTALNHASGRA